MKLKTKLSVLVLLTLILTLMSGCQPKTPEIPLQDILDAVKEEMGDDYIPSRPLDAEAIENITGIKPELVKEFLAEGPMMSMHVDTFMAFRAEAGKGDDIAEALSAYRKFLVEESMQYPMNLAKVQASKVVQQGDYVFFLVLGAFDDTSEDSQSKEAIEFAQKEVADVEKVIEEFFKS